MHENDTALLLETVYARGLEAVAMGETRSGTFAALLVTYNVSTPDLVAQLDAAYRDALRQGVDPEDVDPSWHARSLERGEQPLELRREGSAAGVHCGSWKAETHLERGSTDCGCGWGQLCDAPR